MVSFSSMSKASSASSTSARIFLMRLVKAGRNKESAPAALAVSEPQIMSGIMLVMRSLVSVKGTARR